MYVICKKCGKDEHHYAKGLCQSCYNKQQARIFTEQQIERHKASARKYSKKRYDNNQKENPNWNAERQRQYRKEHPESFNKAMCKCFMKKMKKEDVLNLVKEVFGDLT